jgi:hypothetical protein
MAPDNDAVSAFEVEIEGRPIRTNFCLSKPGEAYLVFSQYGVGGVVSLSGPGRYSVTRVDPRSGEAASLGSVGSGRQPFKLPFGEWVLVYRRV